MWYNLFLMTDEDRFGGYTPKRAARFYVPLLVQAFSQSLTYPLVGAIASRGEYGVDELTAFAQGQIAMFFLGAIGGGLVPTGMVYARTIRGYCNFRRLNVYVMIALVALQLVLALGPPGKWIFETLFNLPAHLAAISRQTMAAGVVMQIGFFLRNVPLVALFNARAGVAANNATFARIGITFLCSLVFPALGWTGAAWALTAITLGILLELLLTWLFARPYVRELGHGRVVSVARQFTFTLPISFGSALLACSPVLLAAFVGRSLNATEILGVHYVTIGIANPVSYAALRMQPVAIQFPPEYPGDRRLLKFAVFAGLFLGLIPLAFGTPWLGSWYYGTCQNIPPHMLSTALLMSALYAPIAVIHAVRGRIEGIAAWREKPRAIMAGQISYFVALTLAAAALLAWGAPGWVVALGALYLAPVATIIAVYAALNRYARAR